TATRRTDMRDDEMLARGGRWAVRLERHLAHPVDAVWRAVTEPAQLAQWFPTTVELDLVVGGAVRFGLPADGPGGRVLELGPPRWPGTCSSAPGRRSPRSRRWVGRCAPPAPRTCSGRSRRWRDRACSPSTRRRRSPATPSA